MPKLFVHELLTDVLIPSDGKARNNVDVSDGNLPDPVPVLGEHLHARPLVPAVTDHKLSAGFYHRHLR